MLHAKQIRAARAMLGWRQQEMADNCGLSMSTIRNLEEGVEGRGPTYRVIQRVFENNGIEFTELDGIRSRPQGVTVFEGADASERFFDHVLKTVSELGGEVMAVSPTVAALMESFGATGTVAAPVEKLGEIAVVKWLVVDSEAAPILGDGVQFRAVSRLQAWPTPYFIYGDRVCFSIWDAGGSFRFLVAQSARQAKEWSSHFLKVWDAAPLLRQRGLGRIARRGK